MFLLRPQTSFTAHNLKSAYTPSGPPGRSLSPVFCSMEQLGVFLLPPGWDASPSQGYPQHFAGTHLYTWVERGTVRVKCLAQEHNTMSLARTRTRTIRSEVEHTNHEATAPPFTTHARAQNVSVQGHFDP